MPLRIMTSSLSDEAFKIIPSQQLLVNVVPSECGSSRRGIDRWSRRAAHGFSDIALTEIIQGKLNFEAAVSCGRGRQELTGGASLTHARGQARLAPQNERGDFRQSQGAAGLPHP